MRNYLILILLLFLSVISYSQPSTFRAGFQSIVQQTPTNGGTYASQGLFVDVDGLGVSAANIRIDTTILVDNRGYKYRVVYSNGGSPLILEFDPLEADADMITGWAIIADPINDDIDRNIVPEVGTSVNNKNRAASETRFRELVDSLLTDLQGQLDVFVSGGNLAVADQLLTADRLISGSDLYDLTIDSLTRFNVYSDDFSIGNGFADFASLNSVATRWNETNTGIHKYNEFGFQLMQLGIVENDSIGRIVISPTSVGLEAMDRESAGNSPEQKGAIYVWDNLVNLGVESNSIQNSEIQLSPGVVRLYARDSLVIQDYNTTGDFRESLTTVLALDTATNAVKLKTITSNGISYDTYTFGVLSITAVRSGGTPSTISNTGTGQFSITSNNQAFIDEIDVVGNNSTLTGSSEIIITINNDTNSRPRLFNVQILDRNSDIVIDPFALGCNITQSVVNNTTTLTISNLNNGFGTAGYKILLR